VLCVVLGKLNYAFKPHIGWKVEDMASIKVEVILELPDELIKALIPATEQIEQLPRIIELEVVNANGKAVVRLLPLKEEKKG